MGRFALAVHKTYLRSTGKGAVPPKKIALVSMSGQATDRMDLRAQAQRLPMDTDFRGPVDQPTTQRPRRLKARDPDRAPRALRVLKEVVQDTPTITNAAAGNDECQARIELISRDCCSVFLRHRLGSSGIDSKVDRTRRASSSNRSAWAQ